MTAIPATATGLALASSGADAAAVVAVEQHHAELAGRLRTHVAAMLATAAGGGEPFATLLALFEVHLAKENELVLPLLAADPSTSLAGILEGMHELLGGHADHSPEGPADAPHGHARDACGCGESDAAVPELDVRTVPHAIRHATVFGAFDAIPAGASLLLVAPHDPLPLLRQLGDRAGGALTVSYEQRGPEAWRLLLTRG